MNTVIATKEQERKALAQITAIVDGLGPDSYIGTAFSGCFDLASQNIENDFALSMEESRDYALRQYDDLAEKYKALKEQFSAVNKAAAEKAAEVAALRQQLAERDREINALQLSLRNEEHEVDRLVSVSEESESKVSALEAENMKLKARLFDLMFAG